MDAPDPHDLAVPSLLATPQVIAQYETKESWRSSHRHLALAWIDRRQWCSITSDGEVEFDRPFGCWASLFQLV